MSKLELPRLHLSGKRQRSVQIQDKESDVVSKIKRTSKLTHSAAHNAPITTLNSIIKVAFSINQGKMRAGVKDSLISKSNGCTVFNRLKAGLK